MRIRTKRRVCARLTSENENVNMIHMRQKKAEGDTAMRIEEHPVLAFHRGEKVQFTLDGTTMEGYEGEPVAAALHANGVKVLGHSHKNGRPRGFYCAIGNCSSCKMVVDGEANVRVCVEPLRPGMAVETQRGKGEIR